MRRVLMRIKARSGARWTGRRNAASASPRVFNRPIKFAHRERIARLLDSSGNTNREYDYLHAEIANHLLDRLDDVNNKAFETVLEIGSRGNVCLPHVRHRHDIRSWIQLQPSMSLLHRDSKLDQENCQREDSSESPINIFRVLGDEEHLPILDGSFDLVVSNMVMHWVNDLPGVLSQSFRALKDDGLFLASMFGENTLFELRHAFVLAELERDGGVSPHVSPFAGIGDMGNLLSRAGFSLPAVDQETITIKYKDPYLLMHELGAMGEQNAAIVRRPFTSRDTLHAAAAIYREMYGDENGAVPATFQILYLTGWTPHHSQPKPKRRGSATHSFKDMESLSQNQRASVDT